MRQRYGELLARSMRRIIIGHLQHRFIWRTCDAEARVIWKCSMRRDHRREVRRRRCDPGNEPRQREEWPAAPQPGVRPRHRRIRAAEQRCRYERIDRRSASIRDVAEPGAETICGVSEASRCETDIARACSRQQ